MRILKNYIIPFCLAALILYILKYFFDEKRLADYLEKLSVSDLFISAIFMFIGFFVNGLLLRFVYKKNSNTSLSYTDSLLLPMTQNVWSYIIPFQGAFIYSAAFLKVKYKIEVKSSIAVYIFIILASLMMGGVVGLIHLIGNEHSWTQYLFFGVLIISPAFLILGKFFLENLNFIKNTLFQKLFKYLCDIIDDLALLFRDKKFLIKTLILDSLYVINFATWSYWISYKLDYNIPLMFFLSLGFLMKLHSLAKITPGNIGVIQLLIGGYFQLFGLDPSLGVVISLIQLVTTFIFGIPVGIVTTLISIKEFKSLESGLLGAFYKKKIKKNEG